MLTHSKERLNAEANKNMAAISADVLNNTMAELKAVVVTHHSRVKKFDSILAIANNLVAAVTPNSACRNGCGHCCYQGVSVSRLEAERIQAATGRRFNPKAAQPKTGDVERLTGVACPFLVEERCSIYAVRPLACRTHFNMSDTTEVCDTKSFTGTLPLLNAHGFILAAGAVLGADWRYIQKWFPAGVTK